jgi:hypothetical protein
MIRMHSATVLLRDDRSSAREDERDARRDARIDLRSGSRLMKIVIDADALEREDTDQSTR